MNTAIAGPYRAAPTFEWKENFSNSAWFALRVEPNHEKSVATILRDKGIEEFLPFFEAGGVGPIDSRRSILHSFRATCFVV
jgi:hypothetical protein